MSRASTDELILAIDQGTTSSRAIVFDGVQKIAGTKKGDTLLGSIAELREIHTRALREEQKPHGHPGFPRS